MSLPTIFGKAKASILADVGLALGQVKHSRGLSPEDMGTVLGRCDDMVAKYIAGDAEMGFVAWMRAKEAWPELEDLIEETERDRVLRGRQRALDLELPMRRDKAA
jgi:hypothetical protein